MSSLEPSVALTSPLRLGGTAQAASRTPAARWNDASPEVMPWVTGRGSGRSGPAHSAAAPGSGL